MKQRLAIRSPFPSDLQIPDWQRSWQRRAISPRLTREDARALELPAACPEALMRVHGFTIPLKLARGGVVRVMPVRVSGLEFARLRNLGCRPRGAHGTEAHSHRQGFRHEPEKWRGVSHVRCSRASRSPRYARPSRVRTALAALLRAYGIKRGPSNLAFQVALDSGDDKA